MNFFFILFIFSPLVVFAQDQVGSQKGQVLFEEIHAAFRRNDYQASLSAIQEYKSLPVKAQNELDRVLLTEAIASAKLRLPDAEKKLNDFIKDFPFSIGVSMAKYEQAVLYYNSKNFDKAISAFESLDFGSLDKGQQHFARFYWGYSLFSQKKLKESVAQFDLIKQSDGIFGPASSYYAGFAELATGDLENALIDLKRIEAQESYDAVVPYLIANIYQRQSKVDELVKYIAVVEKKPGIQNLPEIKLLGSEAYFRKKQYNEALAGYQEYFKSRKDADRRVLFRAGFANFSTNKFSDAVQFFKEIASDKDSVGFYASYYLGISYLRLNQKQFALLAFQTSKSFSGDQKLVEESIYQESKLLYDLGNPDQAIEQMEFFVTSFNNSIHSNEIKELLSSAYVNANNYHKAIQHIEALTSRSPTTDRAYQKATFFYGIEFYNKNDLDKAIDYFKKSGNFPFDEVLAAEANFWCGESLSASGKFEEAIEYYEKALSVSKISRELAAKIRYGLGYARFNQKQYDKAQLNFLEYVNKTTKTDPNLANGYVRLADCNYVSKSYVEAYDYYRKAAELKKTDVDYAYLQAGVMLGIVRRYPEALIQLEYVIRNFPQSVYWDEALFQKAQLEFEQGNYKASQEGYSYLISTKPDSRFVPFAYVRRASSNYNLKDYKKTADDYITALKLYPSHPAVNDILMPLQEALSLAGRAGEFDDLLNKLKETNPNAKGIETVEFETSKNLYFSQDYGRAITGLTKYINSYPDDPKVGEARYYRAESYYRQKDYSNALKSFYEIFSDDKFLYPNRVAGRVSELEFRAGAYDKAIPAYYRFEKLSVNPKEKIASWVGLMDSYFMLSVYDSTLVFANKLLNDPGVSPSNQNKASLFLGKVAMAKGEYEKAKDEFITTINNAQDEFGAEAKFHLAEIQFLLKENRQCYETIISLKNDYASFSEWVGRGFLLLADNFIATGEVFQAKATLKSLEKFPLANIRNQAVQKLNKIEVDELSKSTNPDDSVNHDN